MADPIIIVPYDPNWVKEFDELGKSIREALGDVAVKINHIGSTSIVGLDAKPIIDVQIAVQSFDPIDFYKKPLESLGFTFRENNPDLTKRYFREAPGKKRTHIHVRVLGSWPEQFSLLFRDYMRSHPEDAKDYANLKYELATKYKEDRILYTNSKNPFIWEIMKKANQWSQDIGWIPPKTDL